MGSRRSWKIDLRVGRFLGVVAALLLACSTGAPRPVELALGQDSCASCRMVVGDGRLASQIVTPGEAPLVFDDLGCLLDFLAAHSPRPEAVTFVADHRTGEWVRAADAVYSRVPGLATPMASSLVAHADEASRRADPFAAGGTPVDRTSLFGGVGLLGGLPGGVR